MLEVIDSLNLNVLALPSVLRKSHAEDLLGHADIYPHAAAYDVLADYSQVTTFDIAPDDIVQFALQRRAGLPETPVHVLKTAVVGAQEEVWYVLEIITAFFEEERRAIETRRFDTVVEALDWLGRREALDTVNASLAALSASR
jgi:hypothetical protein